MGMSIITNMNKPMKFLIGRKTIRNFKKGEALTVYSKINDCISQLMIITRGDETWLAPKYSESYTDISQYQTLTDYEWDTNEVYFGNELVKKRYRLYIKEILKTTHEVLDLYLPRIPICVIVTVQRGKYSNISMRFHIYREGEFHIEQDLSCYKQPILYEIYNYDK